MSNDLAVACGVVQLFPSGLSGVRKNKASTIQAPDMSRMILCFTVHTVFLYRPGRKVTLVFGFFLYFRGFFYVRRRFDLLNKFPGRFKCRDEMLGYIHRHILLDVPADLGSALLMMKLPNPRM